MRLSLPRLSVRQGMPSLRHLVSAGPREALERLSQNPRACGVIAVVAMAAILGLALLVASPFGDSRADQALAAATAPAPNEVGKPARTDGEEAGPGTAVEAPQVSPEKDRQTVETASTREAVDGSPVETKTPDPEPTASIPAAPVAEVAVARTESEIVELEIAMTGEEPESFVVEPGTEEQAADDAGLGQAWATAAVNLRAEPDNDGTILAVVPKDAEIVAAADCLHWCEAAYNGRNGFIYKTYIRR